MSIGDVKEGVSGEWREVPASPRPGYWPSKAVGGRLPATPWEPGLLAFCFPQGAALTFSLCSCSLLTRASSWAFLLLRASMRASHWATRQASNSTLFSCVRQHSSQPPGAWAPGAARDSRTPVHSGGRNPCWREGRGAPSTVHICFLQITE